MRSMGLIIRVIFVLSLLIGTAVIAQDEPVTRRTTAPDPAQYQLVEVVTGLERPLLVTHAGDGSGRLFIVEQYQAARVWQDGVLLDTPFLDLSTMISTRGNEQGFLGLAFHPDYAENGLFFVDYTDVNGNTVVARYHVSADDPNVADPDSAEIILTVEQPFANHNGGDLHFGPDGYLYVSLGDGGSAGDPQGNGQNPYTLLGAILRIDVDAESGYDIPADNPFADSENGAPEIWAWGLRNPWRFSFDRATGDLYIGDVGQNTYEEIDFQPAASPGGENYGWNAYEGLHPYSGIAALGDTVLPVTEYNHSQGLSITGGYVYRGEALPDLSGVYFYADYATGQMWALYRDDADAWHNDLFMRTGLNISAFGEDENGELYLVHHGGGRIFRLEAAG